MEWSELEEKIEWHLEHFEEATGIKRQYLHIHFHPEDYQFLGFDGRDEIIGIPVVVDPEAPPGEMLFVQATCMSCIDKEHNG